MQYSSICSVYRSPRRTFPDVSQLKVQVATHQHQITELEGTVAHLRVRVTATEAKRAAGPGIALGRKHAKSSGSGPASAAAASANRNQVQDWLCQSCTYLNEDSCTSVCELCGNKRMSAPFSSLFLVAVSILPFLYRVSFSLSAERLILSYENHRPAQRARSNRFVYGFRRRRI